MLRSLFDTGALTNRSCVLDVGCGTANYLAEIRGLLPCSCWGIDPSDDMLAQARSRPDAAGIQFANGSAEQLDFPDASLDLVFSVDVIHHVMDRAALFGEAVRVLREGGRLCTVTENAAELAGRVHSTYFPDALTVELERYPRIEVLRAELQAAGFNELAEEHVEQPFEVTSADAYRARAFSSLHFISDEALAKGLDAMESDLQRGSIRGVSRYTLLWARAGYNT